MNQTKPTLAERKCGPALEDHSIPSQQSFAGFHRARGPTNVVEWMGTRWRSLSSLCQLSRPSDSDITTSLYRGWPTTNHLLPAIRNPTGTRTLDLPNDIEWWLFRQVTYSSTSDLQLSLSYYLLREKRKKVDYNIVDDENFSHATARQICCSHHLLLTLEFQPN
ncbi:uncharacterized protein AKAW2_30423A [Aspergillus luchuensis]|uniref:Uncharacterized protein n=1 Tax=Aspergillus kawachii TaxID=1069201 RepID=A0A7R7W6T8_ASPKA|nr:uncharacterized protein AKAW2_30423A [Aspergillus luchuensis]BCR97104.1 hypothetical protein AKAW2_30423A [Aspergillus luchuensis]